MQNEVINQLRLDATDDLQKVKDWVNLAYTDAAITTEFLSQKTTVTPTAGGTYTFTSTPIRIKLIQLTVAGVTYRTMNEVSLNKILELRAQATSSPVSGPPYYYAFDGTKDIEVYPKFLGTESMDIWAVYTPTALSSDSDVPVFPEPYSSVIVYGAMVEAAGFSKDLMFGIAGYQQQYQYWLSKLMTHVNRRRGAKAKHFDRYDEDIYIPHDPSTDLRELR